MNATITVTGNANNDVVDYSAEDAASDARREFKVWVVVNDETGEDMTGLMTLPEADAWIYANVVMNTRPNAYKGWVHTEERDVEVFTDEQEELFQEITDAAENVHVAELCMAFRSNGTPDFILDRMEATIKAGKVRFAEAVARLIEGGNEANQAYIRWRKLNK